MKPVPWERHSRRSWAEVPTQTVTSTAVLPPQVSPPAFALSALPPHELGVEVLALPFTVDDGTPVLGVGAAEAAEALGLDLSGILVARRAKGTGGEVVPVPVAGPGDLRLVLLAGLGAEETTDYRRAGAAVARAAFDHESVASAVPGRCRPGGAHGVRRRHDARLVRLPLALAGSRARARTPRRPGRPVRQRPRVLPGAWPRARWRRLALPDAGDGAVQPEVSAVAGRAGRAPRRGGRALLRDLGRRPGWPSRASAASSASARARRRRPG